MKTLRILFIALTLLLGETAMGAVTFQFAPNTISARSVKTRMENNISALLTEINRAANSGTQLDLSGVSMEQGAKDRLLSFWNDASHFVCERSSNVSKCLNDMQGYQVRGIPIEMRPVDSSYDQSLHRELTISLNKSGVITGVRPAYELQEDVSKILGDGNAVTDVRQRREILKWVEDFRCYYNERNMKALRQVYSDDALIITGSVTYSPSRRGDASVITPTVKYKVQSKEEYLTRLANVFAGKGRINVEFDHISVVRHGAKPNIYGVTLHQKWQSGTYRDEGWLFLLWDFSDPEAPQIHVRTWQDNPAVSKDGVFTLDDFFIP